MNRIQKNHRMEFTMIELLVVIAIISILAGMLLPALKGARDKSKQILCTSNLKQIYTAVQLYASDYNEWIPKTTSNSEFAFYIYDYASQKKDARISDFGNGTGVIFFSGTSGGIYICPSISRASDSPYWSTAGGAEAPLYLSSYNATCVQDPNPNVKTGCWMLRDKATNSIYLQRKMNFIKEGCVIMLDRHYRQAQAYSPYSANLTVLANPWQTALSNYVTNGCYAPAWIHQNSSNFLFIDGHVDSYRFTGGDIFDADYVPKK